MPSTVTHGITYPSGSVAPNVPVVMQTQAESVDSAITNATKVRHAEYTGTTVTATANATVGLGPFTADGAKTFNNDFVTPTSGQMNRLTINKAGTYAITVTTVPTASLGATNLRIQEVGAAMIGSTVGGDKTAWESSVSVSAYFAAGAVLEFSLVSSTTATTSSRIRITKVS